MAIFNKNEKKLYIIMNILKWNQKNSSVKHIIKYILRSVWNTKNIYVLIAPVSIFNATRRI